MQILQKLNAKVNSGSSAMESSIQAVDDASHMTKQNADAVQAEIRIILDQVKMLMEMATSIGESSTELHRDALQLTERFEQFTLKDNDSE
jgi:hypothetical protein